MPGRPFRRREWRALTNLFTVEPMSLRFGYSRQRVPDAVKRNASIKPDFLIRGRLEGR